MPTETIHLTDNAVRTSIRILEEVFQGMPVRTFAVRLWDGTVWKPDEGERKHCVLVLRRPEALRQMLLPPTELSLAEAYIFDDVDIEGDIFAVYPLADQLLQRRWSVREKLHLARLLRRLPSPDRGHNGHHRAAVLTGRRHSKERDRHAVTYHYESRTNSSGSSSMSAWCTRAAILNRQLKSWMPRNSENSTTSVRNFACNPASDCWISGVVGEDLSCMPQGTMG